LTAVAPGAPKGVLAAASDQEFFVRGEDVSITFDKPVDGRSPSILVHYMGQDLPAKRVARPSLTAEQAEKCVGDFYSGELGVIYTVSRRDSRPLIRHPRGEGELQPVSADVFEAPISLGKVTFARNAGGRITGFQIDGGRVQHVRFARVELKSAE
jgi:hypothetical protein